MVKKSAVGYRFIYHRETVVLVFSFPRKHDDLKYTRISFVKDRWAALTLFVVYVKYFEKKFFKKWLKK